MVQKEELITAYISFPSSNTFVDEDVLKTEKKLSSFSFLKLSSFPLSLSLGHRFK
jgi:hypothetical protein